MDNIIGGLLVGSLELSVGCRQSMRLEQATVQASLAAGAVKYSGGDPVPNGAIRVDAKLWNGSVGVKQLVGAMRGCTAVLQSMALPWTRGLVIFRAGRAMEIHQAVQKSLDSLDGPINSVVANYDAEVADAMMDLGSEARRDMYPATAEDFRRGIVRRFNVEALSSSDQVAQLIGGQLGKQMAEQRESQLLDAIEETQMKAMDRLATCMRRMLDVCDPNKNRTRVTESLLGDLMQLTEELPKLLIQPDPELEGIGQMARQLFSGYTRDALAEDPDTRAKAAAAAQQVAGMLSQIGIIV